MSGTPKQWERDLKRRILMHAVGNKYVLFKGILEDRELDIVIGLAVPGLSARHIDTWCVLFQEGPTNWYKAAEAYDLVTGKMPGTTKKDTMVKYARELRNQLVAVVPTS